MKHCCELFEVSRAAYYERKQAIPTQRELADAELTEKIIAVHAESKGTYGSPRVHQELVKRGVACGRRRVRRLIRRAGLEGRCKKRWRTTTVPDPAAERAKDLIGLHFGPCTELDRRYVGDFQCRRRHCRSYADRWTMPMLLALCRSSGVPKSGRSA